MKDMERFNMLFMPTKDIFREYECLTAVQKFRICDFLIINSIRNCDIKRKLTTEEEYKLFDIINKTTSELEENIDISIISDNIVEAYGNGKVSMEALEKATGNEILECIIGIGDIEELDEKLDEMESEN